MAAVQGGWIAATDWMPKLHSVDEDIAFCRHLIATCDVWVLRDGPVAGFLARQGEEVLALYLAAAQRGQGHGRAMLDLAKTGRERLELWTFAANAAALGFYRAQGFYEVQRTGGAANAERLPDVRLRWTAMGAMG